MPNLSHAKAAQASSGRFPGAAMLAAMPVFAFFYVLLILPFLPDDGKGRTENMLLWPVIAAVTLALVLQNSPRIDSRFVRSLPILALTAYFLFAAASVTWAYSPYFAFSRVVVAILATIVIVLPFALPIRTTHIIPALHACCAVALAVSAIFVLTTPASPIGHPGYFTHKQELGILAAAGVILSCHEVLFRGWRRILALVTIGLGVWLVLASQSKSATAFALFSLGCSWFILLLCKKVRITPAYVLAAVVFASLFVSQPVEKIGWRLYGDATLTGRTGIWGFTNYQISRKPWLGWGFHSYYFVPNSPQEQAPGYIKDMPSSHSGYLQVKLETGRIGYWIFLIFVYASLHLLERVRRKDPVRAWCYLSIELFVILINLTDSAWITITPVWLLYLIVVAASVRDSLPSTRTVLRAGQSLVQRPRNWSKGRLANARSASAVTRAS
ncbi:O-antigen ligase family protein [Hyphomicrobium sp.]|uniref:O-antigen ligase family protein n=1 Tax=Hyphomicrobium sp. TaxID=82 RepID=UPI002D790DBC|nr:O-antigen ligase family protein [Hyphomicrobium sp.]